MAGDALAATSDVNRIEAPVTWKAYLICAFASFGGIFFGGCTQHHLRACEWNNADVVQDMTPVTSTVSRDPLTLLS